MLPVKLSLGQFCQPPCYALSPLGQGGIAFTCHSSEPVPGRRNFFPLLILSSALAWSYCTYANVGMSAMEASSAIYSWSLATLITATADLRKPTHTHTQTHTRMHTRMHAHTLHRVYFYSPGYKFPIPLQSGPSHATLIVCYITFIKK